MTKHKYSAKYLKQKQSLSLKNKVILANRRIKEWHEHWDGQVYIAFSGGKDSTVLLHLIRLRYPNIPAVFADTGLEYPEIREFVKTIDNVIWIKPSMNFKKVIEKYGYPVISKEQSLYIQELRKASSAYLMGVRWIGKKGRFKISKQWRKLALSDISVSPNCCDVMKKEPMQKYERKTGRKPFIGTMASDSSLRKAKYLQTGCNIYERKHPSSCPLSVWLEKDIWEYIRQNNLPYSKIYDMGYERTGCMFCMFGVHLEGYPNRFQRMQKTHPNLYEYCIEKLDLKKVLKLINVPYEDKQSMLDIKKIKEI